MPPLGRKRLRSCSLSEPLIKILVAIPVRTKVVPELFKMGPEGNNQHDNHTSNET